MAQDDLKNAPATWVQLDDQLLQSCRVWDLRARRYRHPHSGTEGEFYYINSRDWAIVVARTVTGELVMVRQFRWGSDALSWEFPGGIIDAGEDPVAAGLRELREETGYVAESGRLIGQCSPNPAILNNTCHIIFADNVRLAVAGTDWDEHEELEVRPMLEADVISWAKQNKIGHALALVGLLYYQLDQG
jgi:8-oxo-dGTP pyrophosphatase MutT (NUDIX family)